MAKGIRFFVMDVDGTLTDGRIYFGRAGEELKVFDVKDGYAIKCMLPASGIVPVVITARDCKMLELRCVELGVEELHQGAAEKLDVLLEVMERWSVQDEAEYSLANVAYIGDDILDLQCMVPVAEAGGVAGCPADAAPEVAAKANYVCSKPGGRGAVREFAEYVRRIDERLSYHPSVSCRRSSEGNRNDE